MLLLLDLRYKDKKNFRCYQMVHGIKKLSLNLTPFGLPISPFPHVAKLLLFPLFLNCDFFVRFRGFCDNNFATIFLFCCILSHYLPFFCGSTYQISVRNLYFFFSSQGQGYGSGLSSHSPQVLSYFGARFSNARRAEKWALK